MQEMCETNIKDIFQEKKQKKTPSLGVQFIIIDLIVNAHFIKPIILIYFD